MSSIWSVRCRSSTRSIALPAGRSTRSRSSPTRTRLTVEGEGGVLTFVARQHFNEGRGRVRLRAPGLRTGHAIGARRGALGLAEEDVGRGAADRRGVRRRVSARGSRAAERAPSHRALEVRPRAGRALSRRPRRARSALGQGREHLHVGRHFRGHRSRARLGRGGLRRRSRARSRARAGAVSATARRPAAGERLARLAGVRDDVDPRAADLDRRAPRDADCRSTTSPSGCR